MAMTRWRIEYSVDKEGGCVRQHFDIPAPTAQDALAMFEVNVGRQITVFKRPVDKYFNGPESIQVVDSLGHVEAVCTVCGGPEPRHHDGCPRDTGLHDTDPKFREVDEAMHKLWTWAVDLPGYDKKAWWRLEHGIFDLAKRGR